MFKNKILVFFILVFFSNNIDVLGLENRILIKIENQIITSLDVNNEYKYLIALNPNIKNSKKDDVIKFSKRSVIQEKIKRIEIEKNFNNPEIPKKYLEQILENVYSRIGINDLENFKKYLEINNINFENVKKKLEIEALWNELVLIKFSSKIKINEENLKKKIQKDNNKFLRSYLMSEILFEISNIKDLDVKAIEISEVIKDKGFDFAALKYSLSPTSNLGGRLDWINENSLNKNIIEAIKDLEINDFTNPIVVPGGFLILQINEVKNTKIEVDIENELKKLVNFERNTQLSQYSKIYFNKIKKDLEINEL